MKNNLLQKTIEVNGVTNTIRIIEIQSFFEILNDEFDMKSVKDFTNELEVIKDDILSHYPDNSISGPLKRRLALLQEIMYLFQGILVPLDPKASV